MSGSVEGFDAKADHHYIGSSFLTDGLNNTHALDRDALGATLRMIWWSQDQGPVGSADILSDHGEHTLDEVSRVAAGQASRTGLRPNALVDDASFHLDPELWCYADCDARGSRRKLVARKASARSRLSAANPSRSSTVSIRRARAITSARSSGDIPPKRIIAARRSSLTGFITIQIDTAPSDHRRSRRSPLHTRAQPTSPGPGGTFPASPRSRPPIENNRTRRLPHPTTTHRTSDDRRAAVGLVLLLPETTA